jgi:hypothetical protein
LFVPEKEREEAFLSQSILANTKLLRDISYFVLEISCMRVIMRQTLEGKIFVFARRREQDGADLAVPP